MAFGRSALMWAIRVSGAGYVESISGGLEPGDAFSRCDFLRIIGKLTRSDHLSILPKAKREQFTLGDHMKTLATGYGDLSTGKEFRTE